MPNKDGPGVVDSGWTKAVLETAGRTISQVIGHLPFPGCVPNDAKYGVDLGDIKYSEKELLRIASSWRDFYDRSDRVINYLAACNPHLKTVFDRMDGDTRIHFYNRLKEDRQFNWCLGRYPGMELADENMKPSINGLHISDSVARDKIRNIRSPLGALIIYLLAKYNSGRNGPPSQRSLMDRAPSVNPTRPPIGGSEALGLTSYAVTAAANAVIYGTYDSHELYAEQRAKLQGKKAARLLKANIETVISEHKDGIDLPRSSKKGGGIVQCVTVDPGESPSEASSETFRKIKYGETGCTSICGTQRKTAVETCLSESVTPAYSAEDNNMCQQAGPYKSKEALTASYTDLAQQGVYQHERDWRKDQRFEFNGECKDPAEKNFNAYPGGQAARINHEGGISEKEFASLGLGEKLDSMLHKRFQSRGTGFRKNNCRFDEFPGPDLEEEYKPYYAGSNHFQCEDIPQDPSDDLGDLEVYSPDIRAIDSNELVALLKGLNSQGCED